METGCFIKIFVPSDLTFELSRIRANGMFSPASGGSNLAAADWALDRSDSPSPSIMFEGCNKDSDVGASPSGSLLIDSISTPLSIKDSGMFYVKVYKDLQLEREIANIEKGVYIEAVNLEPGTLYDLSLEPVDPAVQVVTTHALSFSTEHPLDQNGFFEVSFPQSLTLPEIGTEMEVIPQGNSMQSRTATVRPGNKVEILGVFEGLAQEDLPGPGHTFVFDIVGIKNQPSAANAGTMTIQTFVRGWNGTSYKVDYGETDETFVAVTGRVIANGEIEVTDPVTWATTSSYILRFRTESVVPEGGRITI